MFRTTFDENTKTWSGPPLPPFNPNESLAVVLLRAMKIHGSKVAQVFMNNNLNYIYIQLMDNFKNFFNHHSELHSDKC